MKYREHKKAMKFFGEMAPYNEGDEEEKQEAKQYLLLWKKFFLRSLQKDCYDVKIIEEIWSERPANLSGMLCQRATLVLKLCVQADFYYELDEKAL